MPRWSSSFEAGSAAVVVGAVAVGARVDARLSGSGRGGFRVPVFLGLGLARARVPVFLGMVVVDVVDMVD